MRSIPPFSQYTFFSWRVGMNWFCSVCEKSFKDDMQRYVTSKHRNLGLTPFQTVAMSSQKCQRLRFERPFSCLIAWMIVSGKSAWVLSLLHQVSDAIYLPDRIPILLWTNGIWSCLMIRWLTLVKTSERWLNLFTRSSHRCNLSVIYIVQNLFHQGKVSRSISLNSHIWCYSRIHETNCKSWLWPSKCIPGRLISF